MIHVEIPTDAECRRLPFFLAVEEWVARSLPEGDYFFAWRVAPTVICGRHQEIDKEVNLEYCRENGIDVVRRRSGGGAVFADLNNWMFSYITTGDAITMTFERYTSMMANALRALGFNAEATGRNDILIDGAKVSGNAFYHLPGRCIVHGTMLLDIDAEHMSHALTPSRAKLESKGVKSVASRVTSLRQCGLTMDIDEFRNHIVDSLCSAAYKLNTSDIARIKELEQRYYDPNFLWGKCQRWGKTERIEGVGTIKFTKSLDSSGRITALDLCGDFFADEDRLEELRKSLIGADAQQIGHRLDDLPEIIAGLPNQRLAQLIIE